MLFCSTELNAYSSKDALARVNDELKPNWETLFPYVSFPSLEFLTASQNPCK